MPSGVYPRTPLSTWDKFWRHVDQRGPDECWPWTGSRDKKGGYGQFAGHPLSRQAHRVAFMLVYGIDIDRSVVVHHTCYEKEGHTPLCCNPGHLELMDDAEHRSMHARERWAMDKAGLKPFRRSS
jgi:hypothetical protein